MSVLVLPNFRKGNSNGTKPEFLTVLSTLNKTVASPTAYHSNLRGLYYSLLYNECFSSAKLSKDSSNGTKPEREIFRFLSKTQKCFSENFKMKLLQPWLNLTTKEKPLVCNYELYVIYVLLCFPLYSLISCFSLKIFLSTIKGTKIYLSLWYLGTQEDMFT